MFISGQNTLSSELETIQRGTLRPPELSRPSSIAPRNSPSMHPRNGMHQGIPMGHQGTPIPRSQRHNAMISMGSGGPGRTRTFDQGIPVNFLDTISDVHSCNNSPAGQCRRYREEKGDLKRPLVFELLRLSGQLRVQPGDVLHE
jgi:hypothetical protein